jgi:hypothetical protein
MVRSKSKEKVFYLILVLVLSIILIMSCGQKKKEDPAEEVKPDKTSKIKEMNKLIHVKRDTAGSVGGQGNTESKQKEFIMDVPIFKPSQAFEGTIQGQENVTMLTLMTKAPMEYVVEFYDLELNKSQWSILEDRPKEQSQLLIAQKGNVRLQVNISVKNGGTRVILVESKMEKAN